MRTTIDLPDALFAKAKRLAHARGTTLRELTIEGLEVVIDQHRRAPKFRLRDASYGKGGLVEGLDQTEWDRIRDLAYEGRGGARELLSADRGFARMAPLTVRNPR